MPRIDDYRLDNNTLQKYLNSIKAEFVMVASGNSYRYVDLTNVTDYTIQSGDILEYSLFWQGSGIRINIDLWGTGFTLRDSGLTDQNGLGVHVNQDIGAYCNGLFYKRQINLSSKAGITLNTYCIACEHDASGTFVAFLSGIKIVDSSGNIRKMIWDSGSITPNVAIQSSSTSHTFTPNILKR